MKPSEHIEKILNESYDSTIRSRQIRAVGQVLDEMYEELKELREWKSRFYQLEMGGVAIAPK